MTASVRPAPLVSRRLRIPAVRVTAGRAVGLLLLAALCWGAGNVANKTLLEHVGPFTALVVRCLLGLAILLPLCRLDGEKGGDGPWLRSALGVSVLFAAALMAQQVAYVWTTVTNVSFLVNTCTAMTALLAWVVLRKRPGWRVGTAGVVTLGGAYLMSGAAVAGVTINPGDLACLVSAIFYAGWMVALGQHAMRHGRPMATSAVQFGLTAVLMVPLSLVFETPTLSGIAGAWQELLFLGIFSTAAACTLVTVAQRHVSAPVAAILVSMESVFGAAGAYLLLGEQTPLVGLLGAALIFGAVALSATEGERGLAKPQSGLVRAMDRCSLLERLFSRSPDAPLGLVPSGHDPAPGRRKGRAREAVGRRSL